MTTEEFSNEFDVLYNNISNNMAPGVNEYEKSVFLTKAQSEIIKAYFNTSSNKIRVGFDASERRQYDFSILLRTANLFNINTVNERVTTLEKIDKRSQVFLFPEDYFLSVNEVISDANQFYSVLPITYTEYQRMMTKPYPYPPKRMAWRIISDKKNCNFIHHFFNDTTNIDLKFLTTWADQKRNLTITVSLTKDTTSSYSEGIVNNVITFHYSNENINFDGWVKVTINGSWQGDGSAYNCDFNITSPLADDIDYESYFAIIKGAFEYYKEKLGNFTKDDKICKVAKKTDAFLNYEAPSKIDIVDGTKFKGEVISLPIAEIIGSFRGDISYQIRYVRRPKPIVLENIEDDGVTIDGVGVKTECELPSELHQEILQRAIELAKAAADGTLASTVAIGNTSSTDIGINPPSNSRNDSR